jgi:CHAT domain-containing protein/tetratricopeptide (TPR) repeat protein
LTLSDSRGRQLFKVDSLTAEAIPPWPAEEIHWVADAAGTLRIDLRIDAAFPAGSRGPCGLRLVERRQATTADRQRAQAEADLARGHSLRLTGKPETCRLGIAPYESAQQGFTDLGLSRRQAEALLGLGLLQSQCLHDDEAAREAFTRAIPLFTGDLAYEATVRQNLGVLHDHLGDLDGATKEYRRALELRDRLGDRFNKALISSNLGHVLHQRGQYDEAAALLDSALALWLPSDDRGLRAGTLLNRGHLHRDLGEADPARKSFEAALPLFHQAENPMGEAAALNALGLLALDGNRYGEALRYLQGALALRPSGSRGWAVTQASLGVAHRALGQLEDARRAYTAALPIFQSLGDSREQASSLGSLGRLETATNQDAAALGHFDQAIQLYRTLADPPDLAWALQGKALVVRRRGQLEEARGLMDEALPGIERYRLRQTSYTTRAEIFASQQGAYDFLIDLLMEMHREAEALELSERSLARSLLDGLAAAGTDFRHGAAPERRELELETQIDALVFRQTRLSQDSAVQPKPIQELEEELRRRWDELDRVRARLRASDPRYAALTQPQPWRAGKVQRELLDRDTLLLEYRLGETRSFLWAVTPSSLKGFELPGRAEIDSVAREILGALATSRSPGVESSPGLARLSRLLLDPVAPLLPGKRLLVVADGVLQNVPFAALLEPGGGEPLVAHHEIVTLPSVSVLGEIRREVAGRQRAPKTLWVLAAPDFGGRFDPLPHSGEEATAILALAPAPKREVAGTEASRAAVLSGALRDYRLLHFATHGLFPSTDFAGGRLVLAQIDSQRKPVANGFLHLSDIYALSLRADLVVLSACQSALGREVKGEGMMGMTRGFFYAGAERVLVSLWNVNDRVTVELMRRFYHGMLVEKLSPAAALRQAQDEIRRQPRWQAPYHWAGFTLQGEWRKDR